MNRQKFNQYIKNADFVGLFNEMGWNNGSASDIVNTKVDEALFAISNVAQRSGFKVYVCKTDFIPLMTVIREIDKRLRKNANDYILIFVSKSEQMHHEWIVPVKNLEKRVLVPVEYTCENQLDFLFSKLEDLSFGLEERTTILDVTKRVGGAFIQNAEKVTKEFYSGFSKQHKLFAGFVLGIDDDKDMQWYVSVMLNRLMFCYFIQKKGFLNFDANYLQNKLKQCSLQKGKDKFYKSFYKSFLTVLFKNGLNKPDHNNPDFLREFGHIPYLNGGMFDEHIIEKEYPDIDIKDEAFENLFAFFDKYNWHLDTRIEASGKDINPDVIGYIFEQYINDRAQMGAYYTKEDITNYIGKNCIIPFLWNKVSKSVDVSAAWDFLKESGGKYVYAAVKKGILDECGNITTLPDNIEIGVDTEKPDLINRRKDWNTPTPEAYGLPTEIWRETIERRNRYFEIIKKIKSGDIKSINDFITYNLDIISFTQDYLSTAADTSFIGQFYKSLLELTVLDPTCGSGAFLFAAMNILEPLYDICIDRMVDFNKEQSGQFVDYLNEINGKYRSNRPYFIYKTIILRNLYGVDIMPEAVEIAKLRLFLKMVAVVEVDRRSPNLGLDPLPDIDFNIRCGNTLVGFANENELMQDFTSSNADLFATLEWEGNIKNKVKAIAETYKCFREMQLDQTEFFNEFKKSKKRLAEELSILNDMLNKYLFKKNGYGKTYVQWINDTQPFHWFAEFYDIITDQKGFDVIIGNPPYVESSKVKKQYVVQNYHTEDCGNLYANCIERSLKLTKQFGNVSMIVPISFSNTPAYRNLRELFCNGTLYCANFSGDTNPGTMFDGVKQNLTIFTYLESGFLCQYCTNFIRFYNDFRSFLFDTIRYQKGVNSKYGCYKLGNEIQTNIIRKILTNSPIENVFQKNTNHRIFMKSTSGSHYKLFFKNPPYFSINNVQQIASSFKPICFSDEISANSSLAVLNSNLFNMWWCMLSDGRNVTSKEVNEFPFDVLNSHFKEKLCVISDKLMKDLNSNSDVVSYNKQAGLTKYAQFKPRNSKTIIDEIDFVLAEHYNFSQEETDFIINYDIKYRMGDEINDN